VSENTLALNENTWELCVLFRQRNISGVTAFITDKVLRPGMELQVTVKPVPLSKHQVAVGTLVHDAIVVVPHVIRHPRREDRLSAFRTARLRLRVRALLVREQR